MSEESQSLTIRARCTLSSSSKRAKGGVPLQKGTGPLRFSFGGQTYTCWVVDDKGPIEIGKTGELTVEIMAISSPIEIKVNDRFELVPRPDTVYADGEVLEIIEDRRLAI